VGRLPVIPAMTSCVCRRAHSSRPPALDLPKERYHGGGATLGRLSRLPARRRVYATRHRRGRPTRGLASAWHMPFVALWLRDGLDATGFIHRVCGLESRPHVVDRRVQIRARSLSAPSAPGEMPLPDAAPTAAACVREWRLPQRRRTLRYTSGAGHALGSHVLTAEHGLGVSLDGRRRRGPHTTAAWGSWRLLHGVLARASGRRGRFPQPGRSGCGCRTAS
jgi:hypothetical protein